MLKKIVAIVGISFILSACVTGPYPTQNGGWNPNSSHDNRGGANNGGGWNSGTPNNPGDTNHGGGWNSGGGTNHVDDTNGGGGGWN